MRMSRVLLAGVAVAAAAAATTAFTDSNTFTGNSTAGYASTTATGVSVTNVAYTPASGDPTKLHQVVFTVGTNTTTGYSSVMTLLNASNAVVATVPSSGCVGSATTITCTLSSDVAINSFTQTGLTVTSS